MKNQKGITLIALIITIVVLLILAGVALNLTIGDNGIFKRANESAKIYQNAANNEAIELNGIYKELSKLIDPSVSVTNIDLNNVKRKTDIPLENIFEIIWGSAGTGTVEYSISGNLAFNNMNFESTTVNNLSELELGTYKIICKVTTSANEILQATKENVQINQLDDTTVVNENNISENAKAIYSEYDLVYFRDLVNTGTTMINGKLMNSLDLASVCSESIGSWIPIGDFTNLNITYDGIFDGNNNTINNLYCDLNSMRVGLFGNIGSTAYLKNIIMGTGVVKGAEVVGAVIGRNFGTVENCINNNCTVYGYSNNSRTIGGIAGANVRGASIKNCTNKVEILNNNCYYIGGITGLNNGIIYQCYNYAQITGNNRIGGIVGLQEANSNGVEYTVEVEKCYNFGNITGAYYIGGILGYSEIGTISDCGNEGEIESISNDYDEGTTKYWSRTGGIVGYLIEGSLSQCYNKGDIISKYGCVGGIAGYSDVDVLGCYNLGTVKGTDVDRSTNIGGIVGRISNGTIGYTYNIGNVETVKGYVGGITGQNSAGVVKNSYNAGTITLATTTNPTDIIGVESTYIGYIAGYNSGTCNSNVFNTTESTLKGWTASQISNYLGTYFVKDTSNINSGYPILK